MVTARVVVVMFVCVWVYVCVSRFGDLRYGSAVSAGEEGREGSCVCALVFTPRFIVL